MHGFRDHFFGDQPPKFTGLTVFILKEEAVANGLTEKVVEIMSRSGVNIVDTLQLTAVQKERAIREIRGGNWTGPDRTTGRPISCCIYRWRGSKLRWPKV